LTTKLTQLSLSRSAENSAAFPQERAAPSNHPSYDKWPWARICALLPAQSPRNGRGLLMPVSIFKEPSPASSAGAWLLSALESGFLQLPASSLQNNKKPGAKRQAVLPRLVGAQRRAWCLL